MRPAVSVPAFFLLGAMSLPWSTAFCADPPTPTEEQTPVSAQQTPVSASLSPEEMRELQETAFQAAERGDGDEVLRYVRLGVDVWAEKKFPQVTFQQFHNATLEKRFTLMERTARKCRPETMEALLDHLLEQTPADETWMTEARIARSNRAWLNNAVSAGNISMAEYLLDRFGKEFSQRTQYELLIDAASGPIEMFDFLQKRFQLPCRIDTNLGYSIGDTKFLACNAARAGNLTLVKRLVQQDGVPEDDDSHWSLPKRIISYAYASKNYVLVHFLLSQGFPQVPGPREYGPYVPDTKSVAGACATGDLALVNAALERSRAVDQPALNNAVASGNLEVVKRILDAGAYINELEMGSDDPEYPALYTAFAQKHFHIADFLLERGIDPHLVTVRHVCEAGSLEHLKKMYRLWNETPHRDEYYDINYCNLGDVTPIDILLTALSCSEPELIRYAVEELHAITKANALDVMKKAFVFGNRPILEYLFRHCPDLDLTGDDGTALLYAAGSNLNDLKFLDAHGVKFGSSDAALNALRKAVRSGNGPSIRFLLEKGVPVGIPDPSGRLEIEFINEPTAPQMIDILLPQYGQDPEGVNRLFLTACRQNKTALISSLLAEGKVDLNARNSEGKTPLLALASSETPKRETLQLLLDHGADIHVRDTLERTPLLTLAANHSSTRETLQLLLDHGDDIKARDRKGNSVLLLARDPEKLLFLLDAGAEVNAENEMHETVMTHFLNRLGKEVKWGDPENLPFLKELLQRGYDMTRFRKEAGIFLSQKAWQWSGNDECTDLVIFLLNQGAEFPPGNVTQQTPLHKLCADFRMEYDSETLRFIFEYLVRYYDVNARDEKGRTPIFYAAERRHLSLIELLHEAGADLNVKDHEGWIPVDMLNFRYRGTKSIAWFLDHGIDIDHQDPNGNTFLHLAVLNEGIWDMEIAEFLVHRGANRSLKNKKGETALDIYLKRNGTYSYYKAILDPKPGAPIPPKLYQ